MSSFAANEMHYGSNSKASNNKENTITGREFSQQSAGVSEQKVVGQSTNMMISDQAKQQAGNALGASNSSSAVVAGKQERETKCDKAIDLGSRKAGENNKSSNVEYYEKNHDGNDEDDDNLVIPPWPCKPSAEMRGNKDTEFVQHKVYSLKDYSQVASPSPIAAASAPGTTKQAASLSSNAGRLLKSVSQDRKIKLRGGGKNKRMSECLYSTPAAAAVVVSASTADVAVNKNSPSYVLTQQQQQVGASGGGQTFVLASESRIDKMRKLFVSPLSLRSGAALPAGAQKAAAGGQRLSLQAGSSMLNKSHHLMHDIYRSSAGHQHGNRRSPMRAGQKQAAAMKSFRVYGCPLQMANNIYPITCFGRADIYKQQSVPYVLARLCNYIEENSSHLTHEGIFRVSGNARLMEKLRTLFDHLGDAPLESESVDVATSASMLKMYLRELPEPLIPARMNYYFISLAKKYSPYLALTNKYSSALNSNASKPMLPSGTSQANANTSRGNAQAAAAASSSTTSGSATGDANERQKLAFARDLTKLVRKLPIENYNLLKYLACFLYRVTLKQQYNKMCAQALGIVFGPNVFRIRSESYKGLKEQELSNQIMASIISNYRSIFDSELTDPLGNLLADQIGGHRADSELPSPPPPPTAAAATIRSNSAVGQLALGHLERPLVEQIEACDNSDLTPLVIAEITPDTPLIANDMPLIEQKSINTPVEVATATSPAGASSSGANLEKSTLEGGDCCAKHCQAYLLFDRGAGESAGLGEGDDDDEDDDCIEGESYTPSTSNGSYCSSDVDSETLESSYDEDDDNEDDDDRQRSTRIGGGRSDRDELHSRSSSECPSDTSYTPTSSHSDSSDDEDGQDGDGDDESVYDGNSTASSSSSLESNLANLPPTKTTTGVRLESGKQRRGQSGSAGQCLVCKRRQSAHILLDPNCRVPLIRPTAATTTKLSPVQASKASSCDSGEAGDTCDKNSTSATAATTSQAKGDLDKSCARPELANESDPAASAPISIPARDDKIAAKSSSSKSKSTKTAGRLPAGSRLEFVRRRSSSASSLGRVKRKYHNQDTGQESAGKSHSRHGRHRQSSTSTGSANAVPNTEVRTRNSTTRRLRTTGASGNAAKTSHYRYLSSGNKRLLRASNRAVGGKQQNTTPATAQLVAALGPAVGKLVVAADACQDSVGSWPELLVQEYGNERFYLMRAFNSDETLMHSVGYNVDLDGSTIVDPQRRFSGLDHLRRKESRPKSSFNEIREETASVIGLVFATTEDKQNGSAALNKLHEPDVHQSQPDIPLCHDSVLVAESDKAAFVSPISSINNDDQLAAAGGDPIENQMRAYKELARALDRLLQQANQSGGFAEPTESLVLRLSRETAAPSYQDDCSACNVDHLAGWSLIEEIDTNLVSNQDEQPAAGASISRETPNQSALVGILEAKIASLKQRYDEYRIIRDHYLRNHSAKKPITTLGSVHEQSTESSAGSNRPLGSIRSSKSESQLDAHAVDSPDVDETAMSPSRARNCSIVGADTDAVDAVQPTENPTNRSSDWSPAGFRAGVMDGIFWQADSSNRSMSSIDDSSAHQARVNELEDGSANKQARMQATCRLGWLCPVEFVFNIEKQLAAKRIASSRPIKVNAMTMEQLAGEKLELQKNLLLYERWFGRPSSRLEFILIGHIYERYRAVKIIRSRLQQQQGQHSQK